VGLGETRDRRLQPLLFGEELVDQGADGIFVRSDQGRVKGEE
jgi:hypothetical protein